MISSTERIDSADAHAMRWTAISFSGRQQALRQEHSGLASRELVSKRGVARVPARTQCGRQEHL